MTSGQYLALTLPLCTWLLAGGLAGFARWRPEQVDVRWMAAGFAVFSVGVASQIVQVPAGFDDSAVVSAFLYHVCAACIAQAMCMRYQVPARMVAGAVVAVVAWAVLGYYAYADANLFMRIYVLNFGLGAQLAVTSWPLWRARPPQTLGRALWWVYVVLVLSFFVRTVLTAPSAQGLDEMNFGQTLFWVVLYLSLAVFAVLLALLYLASALVQAMAQLQRERNCDGLTQLLNRRAFLEAVERVPQPVPKGVLVLLDVDHFKSINDQWGHMAGDAVLQSVAQVLQRSVRASDLVARYGGEEFVLLLQGLTLVEALRVVERMQAQLASTAYHCVPASVRVTVSCGMALLVHSGDVFAALKTADRLLYQAKSAGRNRVCWEAQPAQDVATTVG